MIILTRIFCRNIFMGVFFFFFSSRRRHTRWTGDWSSEVCSSDLGDREALLAVFDSDAAFISDGGGKSPAARRIIIGPDAITRLLTGLERKWHGVTTHRIARSEERRVGKECRAGWGRELGRRKEGG